MAIPSNSLCQSCRAMFADRTNLKLAMSEAGFDLTVDRDTFRTAIEENCSLCTAFLGQIQEENLEEIRAQALYDPEDIEGMDEADYHSLEPFRVMSCSREDDQKASRSGERLVRNIYLEVPEGRARYDFSSMWITAWSADNRNHLSIEFEVLAAEGTSSR